MLVLPSDHVIDAAAFLPFLDEAVAFAAGHDLLVTFGIRPTRPETGYGYIERGDAVAGHVHRASSFREKPSRELAEGFVAGGRFLWNSGMFAWRARVLLDAVERHAPEIWERLAALEPCDDGSFTAASLARYYRACPAVSIDNAVLEREKKGVAVCVSTFAWCDVGSWGALGDVLGRDGSGNVSRGSVLALDTERCVFYADGGRIAAVGVRDVVVVAMGGVTMICPADDAGRVRDLVRALGDDSGWTPHL
jgi:mannose-1-phosphate guanylyltransferase